MKRQAANKLFLPNPFQLIADYQPAGDQPEAIVTLVQNLQRGLSHQTLLGVTGSGKTFTIANVIAQVQRPTLVLAPNKTLAAQLYGELKTFFPHNAVDYFVSYYDYYQPEAYVPSTDTFIEKDAAINEHIEQMRLAATKSLIERRDAIIVATVSAIYGIGDPSLYLEMTLTLQRGDTIDQRLILRRLAELQYTRSEGEFHRAHYRVRGDVIDVFPAESAEEAVRIELFGDEIEHISYFDPLTGTVQRRVSHVTFYPKSHYVSPKERILQTIDRIKDELQQCLVQLRAANKLLETQRLEQRTQFDIEMLLELGYCNGIENYSRYLSGRLPGQPPPTLLDYLPPDALLVIDESHVTVPQLGAMYRGNRSRKETLVTYGFRLPSALDNRPLQFQEFLALAPQTIYVSATPGPYELKQSEAIVEQLVRPTGLVDPEIEIRPVASQVDDLLSEITQRAARQERVLVTTLTKRLAENLSEYLTEHGVKVRYLHSDLDTVERMELIRSLRLGKINALVGINLLREGLDIPEVSLVAILDADKEGFLRSECSLIQTIGRAARHVAGKAILYADSLTGSIQRALAETRRRREKQHAHNARLKITPQGISKAIYNILESNTRSSMLAQSKKIAEQSIDYPVQSLQQTLQQLKQLEKQMLACAKELRFEEAIRLRDKIKTLNTQLLHSNTLQEAS